MHKNWKKKKTKKKKQKTKNKKQKNKNKNAYKVVSNTHRVMPWLQGQTQDFKLAGVDCGV